MVFKIIYHEKVSKDILKLKLSKSQLIKLKSKIESIAKNPYPKEYGGLGECLSGNLKGLMKFRFDEDYRVVYRLLEVNGVMEIIIIGLRKDKAVYKNTSKRI